LTDTSINEGRGRAVRAAVVQLNSTEDREQNLDRAADLVSDAAGAGAELVVLPEKFNRLGDPDAAPVAPEPLDGPTVAWASGLAHELGVELVAGSLQERATDGRCFNTSVHVGRDGELRAVYRKLHLFDVEVDGRIYRESAHERPGEEIVVSRLAGGPGLGLTVCYDLRFPELYRILALRGALVLTVASAFTLATTRDHWEPLLRARAIENGCFVLAANQIGARAGGDRCGGRSMIVDPWGLVLAQVPDAEGVAVAELDFGAQAAIRGRLPTLAHRRPATYRWPVGDTDIGLGV